MMLPLPNAAVDVWLSRHEKSELFFSSVSEAELRYGIALLPSGRRKERLKTSMEAMLQRAFQNRVLSFDRKSAHTYAEIAAARKAAGRPYSRFDCQIASIASSNGCVLATRNISDFVGMGVDLINPWSDME